MELYERILYDILARDVLPLLEVKWEKLFAMRCYCTIARIHAIVSDDTLDDPECFQRIEEIILSLEELGLDGGGRHDF